MHGAEVITVDNPKEIDSMRLVAGAGAGLHKHAMSHSFMAQAANKKSMQLDLSMAKGQEIFRRLAADSDVVVENLVTGGMAKFGLTYNDLKKVNPRLIYCSLTGYGQTGPNARRAAIDGAVQAASGLMSLSGTRETGPMKVGFLMADYATGYAAALGIVSALYYRPVHRLRHARYRHDHGRRGPLRSRHYRQLQRAARQRRRPLHLEYFQVQGRPIVGGGDDGIAPCKILARHRPPGYSARPTLLHTRRGRAKLSRPMRRDRENAAAENRAGVGRNCLRRRCRGDGRA
jgi:hypothetical protein